MLWMKAWLETRWRLLYAVVLPLAALALPYIAGGTGASAKNAKTLVATMAFFCIFNAGYLAGAGIKTQSPFAAMKGLHGSLYYTLSLPVSRLRLLSVRAGTGLIEFAGVCAIVYSALWFACPAARPGASALDLCELILAAVACMACFYFVSVLLGTFLDDPWQTFGALFVAAGTWFLTARFSLPPSLNVFGFATHASPLITHALPWPAMAISIAVSIVLFVVARKIAEAREY